MSKGWCEWAIPCPGPPEKTGYSGKEKAHAKVGVVLHTMEYESTPEWNDTTTLHNALFSEREASWTFSICRFMNGALLFQHYPIGTVCWAQGYQGNLWLDSIETEGIAPEKLSEAQYELLVKTLRWIGEQYRYEWWEGPGNRQTDLPRALQACGGWLFEHAAVPGAPPTNCQVFTRGQVDPQRLLRDLKEGDMSGFSQVQLNEMKAIIDKAISDAADNKGHWDDVEMAARGAVSTPILKTFLSAITGHWENLVGDLDDIEKVAKQWSRWG